MKRDRPDDYVIPLLDVSTKRWCRAAQLLDAGVPLKYAERYRKQRWLITVGLRRRVKDERN